MTKDVRSDVAKPGPLRGVPERRLDRGLREWASVVATEDAVASQMPMRFQSRAKFGRERDLPLASALR